MDGTDSKPRAARSRQQMRQTLRIQCIRDTIGDQEDGMRRLPPEVLGSIEWAKASLSLRLVHQLLYPTRRHPVFFFRLSPLTPTNEEALMHALACNAVAVSRAEAEALIKEALDIGLWEFANTRELAIFLTPRSLWNEREEGDDE